MSATLISADLRRRMKILHTWGGLYFGWLLMPIFVGGTISVFAAPVTAWMGGRLGADVEAHLSLEENLRAISSATLRIESLFPAVREWQISIPDKSIEWRDASGAWVEEKLSYFESDQDTHLKPRMTKGGSLFVQLHYALWAGFSGILLVGLTTVAMLAALVSGIIIHKRIFTDYFVLRRHRQTRTFLDFHNIASVLTLPFQIMIAYTGLAIFLPVFMPAAVFYNFGMPDGLSAELQMASPYADARHTQHQPKAELPGALTFTGLRELVEKAQAETRRPVEWINRTIDREGVYRLWITMMQEQSHSLPPVPPILFQVIGAPAHLRLERREPAGWADKTLEVMVALHEAHSGGIAVKWMWFCGGISGCIMIATGLILFERRYNGSGETLSFSSRKIVQTLNTATICGLLLASIAYLWANRLIPEDFSGRQEIEVRCFGVVWLGSALYALFRESDRAWVEELYLAAILCLTLPLLNFVTTGYWFGSYARHAQWDLFWVEVVVLIVGTTLAKMVFLNHQPNKGTGL